MLFVMSGIINNIFYIGGGMCIDIVFEKVNFGLFSLRGGDCEDKLNVFVVIMDGKINLGSKVYGIVLGLFIVSMIFF